MYKPHTNIHMLVCVITTYYYHQTYGAMNPIASSSWMGFFACAAAAGATFLPHGLALFMRIQATWRNQYKCWLGKCVRLLVLIWDGTYWRVETLYKKGFDICIIKCMYMSREPNQNFVYSSQHILKIYRFDFMADEMFTDRRIYTECRHSIVLLYSGLDKTINQPRQSSADAINSLSLQHPQQHTQTHISFGYHFQKWNIQVRTKSEIRRWYKLQNADSLSNSIQPHTRYNTIKCNVIPQNAFGTMRSLMFVIGLSHFAILKYTLTRSADNPLHTVTKAVAIEVYIQTFYLVSVSLFKCLTI